MGCGVPAAGTQVLEVGRSIAQRSQQLEPRHAIGAGSCHSGGSARRHVGHSGLMPVHRSRQVRWKMWPQGVTARWPLSPRSTAPRQMRHSQVPQGPTSAQQEEQAAAALGAGRL